MSEFTFVLCRKGPDGSLLMTEHGFTTPDLPDSAYDELAEIVIKAAKEGLDDAIAAGDLTVDRFRDSLVTLAAEDDSALVLEGDEGLPVVKVKRVTHDEEWGP